MKKIRIEKSCKVIIRWVSLIFNNNFHHFEQYKIQN